MDGVGGVHDADGGGRAARGSALRRGEREAVDSQRGDERFGAKRGWIFIDVFREGGVFEFVSEKREERNEYERRERWSRKSRRRAPRESGGFHHELATRGVRSAQ